MNVASGALSPLGFVGRGSTYDLLRVEARCERRNGVGVDGRGSSQYGQRVDGSIDGSRNTAKEINIWGNMEKGRAYTNHHLVKYPHNLMDP